MNKVAFYFLLIINILFSASIKAEDSLATEPEKIMIIPFSSDMYFSNADKLLADYNKKEIRQIRNAFRYGLNVNIKSCIKKGTDYEAENILSIQDAAEDLNQIYKNLDYGYATPTVEPIVEDNGTQNPTINPLTKILKYEEEQAAGDEYTNMGRLQPGDHESKYMHAQVYNKAMFDYLYEKYGTSMFIFINQLEFKSNYLHCLDRSTNNFEREIIVHFSIYDSKGEHFFGNSVSLITNSNSRDLQEIIKEDMPKIASYITSQLPVKIKAYQTNNTE